MFWLDKLPIYETDWWWRIGLNYPVVLIFALLMVFAYGSCLGSFLNVCIWRMPRNESISKAPSHCTSCGADIHWYDNLPVLSYLILRGRCRKCHAAYSPRYLIVEVITGLLFIAIFVKTGLTQQPPGILANYFTLLLLAIASSWIDYEHGIIPDKLTYPAMIAGIAYAFIFPSVWGVNSYLTSGIYALLSGLIPGIFLIIFATVGKKIARTEVLGGGDIKFVIACGILLGLPATFFILLVGSFSGVISGTIQAITNRNSLRKQTLRFGPYLAGAALIWVFLGNWLLTTFLCWKIK